MSSRADAARPVFEGTAIGDAAHPADALALRRMTIDVVAMTVARTDDGCS